MTTTKNNDVTFYTRFKRPPNPSIEFKESSLVQPDFAFECDINNLVRTVTDKDGRQHTVTTSVCSNLPPSYEKPQFGDFTMCTPEKLLEAKNLVAHAQSQFEMLPSEIRDRFSNNPEKLISFLSDDGNYDEALKLGLVNKRPEKVEDVTPVTPLPVTPVDKQVTDASAT